MNVYYKIGENISGVVSGTDSKVNEEGKSVPVRPDLPQGAEEINLDQYNKIQSDSAAAFQKASAPKK